MKFYIAFSIHGTNQFTVATRQVDLTSIEHALNYLGQGFKVIPSRRPGYDSKRDGFKLSWTKLNRADGTPLQNKGWVTKRFNELKAQGWTLVEAKPCTK